MSGWSRVLLVAGREVRERGRSKAFVISSGLIVVVAALLAAAPALIHPSTVERVGVVGEIPPAFAAALDAAAGAETDGERSTEVTSYPDQDTARRALVAEQVDVVWDPSRDELVWERDPQVPVNDHVNQAVTAVVVAERAAAQGLTPDQLQDLLAPPPLRTTSVNPSDPDRGTKIGVATLGTVVLFMAIVLAGNFVLSGVIEEKTSRVVEILLAQVGAHELLAGKVLGIAVLALAQLGAVAAASLASGAVAGTVSVPTVGLSAVSAVLLWFILGYAFYAVAFAAAGSLVNRQEDAQAVTYPVMAPLFVGYFVAVAAVADPEQPLVRALSLLPPTAPMVMPLRMQLGVVSPVEVAVAIVATLAGAYGLIRLGGRVYLGALLHTGGRVKVRDALASGRSQRD